MPVIAFWGLLLIHDYLGGFGGKTPQFLGHRIGNPIIKLIKLIANNSKTVQDKRKSYYRPLIGNRGRAFQIRDYFGRHGNDDGRSATRLLPKCRKRHTTRKWYEIRQMFVTLIANREWAFRIRLYFGCHANGVGRNATPPRQRLL